MGLSTVEAFKHMGGHAGQVELAGDDLKRYQGYLLEIAEDVIGICEEFGVRYHLTGGTCLGAVRHGGFIPWDDDLDIDLLEDDFELFRSKFLERFGDKYWVHTWRTHDYGMTFCRVRLKGSVFRGREDIGNEECGFFIDVMTIENVPNFAPLRYFHGFLCMGAGFLLSCRNFFRNRELMKELAEDNPEFAKVYRIKSTVGRLISWISLDRCTLLTWKIYSMCKNSKSKYVTVPAGRKHFFGELRLRKDFVQTRKWGFEGHQWDIPYAYDEYLKSMYGDYMTPPPEGDREEHILLELKFPEKVPESPAKIDTDT